MMTVRFTKSARGQFLEGLAYIKQDNPTAARQFKKKAERVLRRLQQFPDSGRVIPEYPEADLWLEELLRSSMSVMLVRGD